jgi:SPOR domain
MNEPFVTVGQFPSEAQAQLLVIRLGDAGIPARLANNQIHNIRDLTGYGAYVWVQVAPENTSQAQEIAAHRLPELSDTELQDLDAEADALAACPACGAAEPEYTEDAGQITGHCAACDHRWTLG